MKNTKSSITKKQSPNNHQKTIFNNQTNVTKNCLVIGNWDLDFIWLLYLGIWLFLFGFCILNFSRFVFAENKWSGVDETVVEKFAQDAGRQAWTPFINTDQGDLLLFVFLLAGAIGGFVLGYFFRRVFVDKTDLVSKDVKRNIF